MKEAHFFVKRSNRPILAHEPFSGVKRVVIGDVDCWYVYDPTEDAVVMKGPIPANEEDWGEMTEALRTQFQNASDLHISYKIAPEYEGNLRARLPIQSERHLLEEHLRGHVAQIG